MSLRNLLALVILLSVAALAATLVLNLPEEQAEDLQGVLPKHIDLALEKVHYTQTEGGRRRWMLDADSAAYQRKAGLVSLQNVKMTFFDTGPYAEIRMTANEGLFDQTREQVEVWGDVQIVTDREEHIYTERLRYEDESRLVSSDEKVRLVSPRLELTGKGLRLDIDAGRMSLFQNVWARFQPAPDERDKP